METAQTLDRGLLILSILAESRDGLTVSQLARELAVSRTVVYRLIATLEARGFVRRSEDGRYRLGLESVKLSARLESQLREVAAPHLRALADQLGATAYVVVADGGDAVVIAAAEPAGVGFAVRIRIGTRAELAESAAGRAIIAARGADAVGSGSTDRLIRGPLVAGSAIEAVAVALRMSTGLEAALAIAPVRELEREVAAAALVTTAASVTAAMR